MEMAERLKTAGVLAEIIGQNWIGPFDSEDDAQSFLLKLVDCTSWRCVEELFEAFDWPFAATECQNWIIIGDPLPISIPRTIEEYFASDPGEYWEELDWANWLDRR